MELERSGTRDNHPLPQDSRSIDSMLAGHHRRALSHRGDLGGTRACLLNRAHQALIYPARVSAEEFHWAVLKWAVDDLVQALIRSVSHSG